MEDGGSQRDCVNLLCTLHAMGTPDIIEDSDNWHLKLLWSCSEDLESVFMWVFA